MNEAPGRTAQSAAALVAAVARGDDDTVRALLADGADPDARDGGGRPVLHLAIDRFAEAAAEALVDHGADLHLPGADGRNALLRTVDSGSPDLLLAVVRRDPQRLSEADRAALLASARHWHEVGVETELRRRTGAAGPVERHRAQDRWTDCDEVSLGGLTVRDGHTALLTELETEFDVPAPFEELLRRALDCADTSHATWSAAASVIADTRDDAGWDAAAALRDHPDPLVRHFGVDVLRMTYATGWDFLWAKGPNPWARRFLDVLLSWSDDEDDPEVLALVLYSLAEDGDPRVVAALLPHLDHPDGRVRAEVARGLLRYDSPTEHLDVVLSLTRDSDPLVRQHACYEVAAAARTDRREDVVAALAERLEDEHPTVLLAVARSLAICRDARCLLARDRLPKEYRTRRYDDFLDPVWHYETVLHGPRA
ncbi:HEAT repeat domain-containing protein [Streptomyces sp. NPDC017979]|uniref:HEAT repeat domain-containing protein n=1 Tax=Streptomyces sp. NPDC017979 TaxID=3365024 RepID=UPI003790CC48